MKKVILFLVFGFIVFSVYAASHTDLYPLLSEIKGWKAQEPVGTSMEGMMTTATKIYTKADATVTIAIVKSKMVTAGLNNVNNVQLENDQVSTKIETINGFKVTTSFDKKGLMGSFSVIFAEDSMLTMTSEKLEQKDAMDIFKQFDWNKIKKALK